MPDNTYLYRFNGEDLLEREAISLDPKHITQSLERLELAFIPDRKKSTYSYKVPLFTRSLKERDCARLYEWEIKGLKASL